MFTFSEVIRAKLIAQNFHLPLSSFNKQSRLDILDQSWFISGDYGIQSRSKTKFRLPTSQLLKDGALKIPINKIYRIISIPTYLSLLQNIKQSPNDPEMISIIEDAGTINKFDLAKKLNISINKLNYRLRKEINTWNILKIDDNIWHWSAYSRKFEKLAPKGSKLNRNSNLILKILERYPFLSASQISLLTGINLYDLARPINDLARKNLIKRGISRDASPDEYFNTLIDLKNNINWTEIDPFILEKGDALIEIIKLERDIKFENGNYWFFIFGIPQAEFNISKKGKSRKLFLENLHRLSTTANLNIPEILVWLEKWSQISSIPIEVNLKDNPFSRTAIITSKLLLERGYILEGNDFVLRTNKMIKTSPSIAWQKLSKRHSINLELNSLLNSSKLLEQFGQLDDIQSIACRMNISPKKLNLENIVYISGIHNRLGYVPKSLVTTIISGWPRIAKLNLLDREILSMISKVPTATEIASNTNRPISEVVQRLRYLESTRLIRRKIPISKEIKLCTWISFQDNLNVDIPLNTESRSITSIVKLFEIILIQNIPLTIKQLSRYFGLTTEEIGPIKKELIRSGKIIEGYFIDGEKDMQLTTPDIHDLLNKEIKTDEEQNDKSSIQRIDLVPENDPLTKFHLTPLVMSDNSLIPTKRNPIGTETWMILYDSIPIGYILKFPSRIEKIDYEIDISIATSWSTNSIIAGVIQKMVDLMRSWYDEEGKINTINGILTANRKWEPLHFLIESIGL